MKDQKVNLKEIQEVRQSKRQGKRYQAVRAGKIITVVEKSYGKSRYPQHKAVAWRNYTVLSGGLVTKADPRTENPYKKKSGVKSASSIAKEIHKAYMLDIDELNYFAND